MRVLIASHAHPAVSNGGAEIAAHRLFEELSKRPDYEVWFLGCDRHQSSERLGSAITQPFGPREFLYAPGEFDWFKFANRDPRFSREFERLLRDIRPDIVHFHHYINFGVEAFQQVKRAVPDALTVVTLHEYLAICNHFGQMITRPKRNLCYEASTIRCGRCFPENSRADFFLRQTYIQQFFGYVDHFISPSHFLAERYIAWGVAPEKMSVVENVIALPRTTAAGSVDEEEGSLRVGFFGQISALKGMNVLFDAAHILEAEENDAVLFDVHGDYQGQPMEFQTEFLEKLEKVGRNVHYHGPYDNQRVDSLMRSADVVLVPSIWWENSPVVIQEALRNKIPIVCSDIGGMAEKVQDKVDGFHFVAGSAAALASLLKRLAANRRLLERIGVGMRGVQQPEAIILEHVALYHRLSGVAPSEKVFS